MSDAGIAVTNVNGPWYREIDAYQWRTLILAILGYTLDAMDFLMYALVMPLIMKEFAISGATAGFAFRGRSSYLPDGAFFRPLDQPFKDGQEVFIGNGVKFPYGSKVLMNTTLGRGLSSSLEEMGKKVLPPIGFPAWRWLRSCPFPRSRSW